MDGVETRLIEDVDARFKALGITGVYTFPKGHIMGLPEFSLKSDRFIYELKGGDNWYRELVLEHTGLRVFNVNRSKERTVFFIA